MDMASLSGFQPTAASSESKRGLVSFDRLRGRPRSESPLSQRWERGQFNEFRVTTRKRKGLMRALDRA